MARKLANETSREELLIRDVKILFDENRRLKLDNDVLKKQNLSLTKQLAQYKNMIGKVKEEDKEEFEEIGFYIQSQRKSMKLSYGAMARLFDRSATTIENYEKCRGSFKNAKEFAEQIREFRRNGTK